MDISGNTDSSAVTPALDPSSLNSKIGVPLEALSNVAVLTYHSRSGSVFLQSLMDNHPQLLMVPGMHLMCYYRWWKERNADSLSREELFRQFVESFAVLFDVHAPEAPGHGPYPGRALNFHTMGENREECTGVDKEQFLSILDYILPEHERITRKRFFQAIHLAHGVVLRGELHQGSYPLWIFFHLHAPAKPDAEAIIEDFPEALFLHAVREPVQTFGSRIKQIFKPFSENGFDTIEELLHRFKSHYYLGVPIVEKQRARSYGVRLEDLKFQPKETLSTLCDIMGIPWSDTLLKSTFEGIEWWNIQSAVQIRGFDKTTVVKRHEDLFNEFDRFRLRALAKQLNEAWEYESELWEDTELMCELLKHPFKFEKVLFSDDVGRAERNQLITECLTDIWRDISSYLGPQKQIQLLKAQSN